MSRVKNSVKSRQRRKKVLKLAKGFRGGRSKLYRTAADAVDRAL
ncbi:MAG: 50S ribosomal protein L20, partial [Deltaproteobacteria bacterium]|nr:50S ribosomal protein L20 [Deltaproteobacteria bacterium]